MKTLIHRAEIINENQRFKGSLLIEDDIISRIFREDDQVPMSGVGTVIDAGGKLLLPGVIDDQVHFREPGLTHKGDLF
jgi:dihydroorotase